MQRKIPARSILFLSLIQIGLLLLLILFVMNRFFEGRAAFGFLCWYAGNQSGCLPMEARISRLMASSPGSNSCPDSAMSQR